MPTHPASLVILQHSLGFVSHDNYILVYYIGVKFLKSNLLVTTSIDQRLNLWSYDPMEATIKLASSFTHDVADVASLQVLRYRLVTQ